ncbi:MAG: cysteine synthase family protein [Phycisphaerales bacterium JB040]
MTTAPDPAPLSAVDATARVHDAVLDLLPGVHNPTPLVRVRGSLDAAGIDLPGYALYAKLEWLNPFGSVKDRIAAALIAELEERGELDADRTILEPTSGNTGLALALVAAARGYPMHAIVPDKAPLTKKALLRLAGATLETLPRDATPAPGHRDAGVSHAASRMEAEPGRFAFANQYASHANVTAHFETTGPEIWRQTEGRVTHLFASLGTTGTIVGSARYLKQQNPDVRVVCVVPDEDHDVPGVRTRAQLASDELLDESVIDEFVVVEHPAAYDAALDAARRDALLAGPSAGLILEGARRVLNRDTPGQGCGVMIFCDDALKYIDHFIKHRPDLAEGTTP